MFSPPRHRIWTEFLPPEVLLEDRVQALLRSHRLQPIIALPPKRCDDRMARALESLAERGIEIGIWPLLSDDDGYWPSEHNAERFEARVFEALEFADHAGPTTVAIDLEPPLKMTRALVSGRAAHVLGRRLWQGADQAERRARARIVFSRIVRDLRARGLETFAALVPLVVFDIGTAPVFQRLLGTEFESAEWDRLSPMFYTSMIAKTLPSRSYASARELLYQGCRILSRAHGDRSSVSLGIVGRGKLGDEPSHASWQSLAKDASSARHAGINDLALFSLEGVLEQDDPEQWLRAFTESPPESMGTGPRRLGIGGAVTAMRMISRTGRLLRR